MRTARKKVGTALSEDILSPQGQVAITLAGQLGDSISAAKRLRQQFPPALAAEAATQVTLRAKAVVKFGQDAANMFFTPEGLEQATRASVAAWRAQRFRRVGVEHVLDLCCGIGADARAFVEAGMRVTGVEIDPKTAAFAKANVSQAEIICADARQVAAQLITPDTAVFIDPARRNEKGRSWRPADFRPGWDFVTKLLTQCRALLVCVKLGPGLPREFIDESLATTWVSDNGQMVEASLWKGIGEPGDQIAVLLPQGVSVRASGAKLPSGPLGRYLWEPDPAILRAQAIADVAGNGRLVSDGVGYVTSDEKLPQDFGTLFEIDEVLDYNLKTLKAWVRDNDIGVVEIKKRAVGIDPVLLRRKLKLRGSASATLVLTPTLSGTCALVVHRV